MNDLEQRVLDHLATLRFIGEDELGRVYQLIPDNRIAAALNADHAEVTTALYALRDDGRIDVYPHTNYGPIVTVVNAASVPYVKAGRS